MGKGFGKPLAIPTRNATKFMHAFAECCAKAEGDEKRVNQFLKSNLTKLNNVLLEALPFIFIKLSTNGRLGDRQNVASLFVVFGNAIKAFPLSDLALNLELSVTAYQLALKVFTRDALPENWAMTQNNLGIAYSDRILGNRSDNIEQAIKAYKAALQVCNREAFPRLWGTLQSNLGFAYSQRILGDRAENLEKAIKACQLALQAHKRNAFLTDWAQAQNSLGGVYHGRIRGDRAENLEKAIKAYQLALQGYTYDKFPVDWARIQNNLGIAYFDRVQGSRTENLEKAIEACKLALHVRTSKAFPKQWAATQSNLGNIYRNRIKGDRLENLIKAINAFQLASEVRTREALPELWAATQGDFAEVLIDLASIDSGLTDLDSTISLSQETLLENSLAALDSAISLLQESIGYLADRSVYSINNHYRLGNALSRRYEHSQEPEDLRKALQAYQTVLDTVSPEHYNKQEYWQALPATQSILGSRLVREGQWQEGLQLLLNSVRLLGEGDDPLAHANALYQTGRAHEAMADLNNARLYYRDALRLYEHLQDSLGIAQSCYGLGSVLVSQGYFEKGMVELTAARDIYQRLNRGDLVAEIENLYQAAQRAEQDLDEVAV